MNRDHKIWDLVAEDKWFCRSEPKAVYVYKKRDLLDLVRYWAKDHLKNALLIKTDLMEESVRMDDVLFDLADEVKKAYGMDISFKLTSLAKARVQNVDKNIEYVTCDIRNLSFKEGAFDIVLSNSTMDHFPEIERAMEETFRVLKPGGIMIVTIHNKLEFTFYLYHFFKKVFEYMPHCHFEKTYTPWEIRDKLSRCGFIIEECSTTAHIPMGLWGILNGLVFMAEHSGRTLTKAVYGFINFIITVIERIERKQTALNYLTSLLIAFKVRKPG